ncbi:uncharacterized protein THITE_2118096 [Thermothielavioides terrestris NRRL 8126]|jgi:hypothetical protein|uniref:MARVEL domain-containing protein n=1 Tax=Thermothielavioides terrestris (strain ATCC 38088 / NRRL 8126) TaxID=578455 RepID=G2R6X0_THETT|nr:uncharacterized protein THITE_2118096 [Thermothielavioides terrestris NRRL 8126]AEO68548.1 hypothetical protein THITE_2118096 [Thermothielavioides terrestris NRRL 8126]
MGVISRGAQVALRIFQLIGSVIVLGILGHFLHELSKGGAARDGRAIYGVVVASISTLFVLVFMAPFMYSFHAFPGDFALFVMWLILFCLLITVRCVRQPAKGQQLGTRTDRFPSPAHWRAHMWFPLVLQLLGILLGRVVEGSVLPGLRELRMRQLADRARIFIHGDVCVPRHHHPGMSTVRVPVAMRNSRLTRGCRVV